MFLVELYTDVCPLQLISVQLFGGNTRRDYMESDGISRRIIDGVSNGELWYKNQYWPLHRLYMKIQRHGENASVTF